ncbi:5'/3'-nucleotidase SurE [Tissierella pigra]|uniref:5'-nucleotidase SurE n=1 Tax=Tissierella pigra TaxID=2607614 RepID=A0A6N7Y425_9FIRM|nr:5'/3'-nucleotidase SurE [Tissierella pigra]MBU5424790.1 5'/3'-nucleotidase SurE [Tissierella pigra]MSU02790.1 5'/3'-nucleotidase SurE [Tissierella pigra]
MRILLANDDGVMAEGIYTLAKELEKEHEIIIVAPDMQRSAQSHAITLGNELIVKEVDLEGLKSKAYSVSGTPADCIRVGLEILSEEKVDLVLSGINFGFNSGLDILYSGTVSAAIEGNIYNIPSVAISAEVKEDTARFDIAAKYVRQILENSMDKLLKSNIVLNINIPYKSEEDILGIKVCKIGGPIYDYYLTEYNEKGEKILRLKGRKDSVAEEDTDRFYLNKGYVTVTPLYYDLTNFKLLEEIKTWI